MSVDVSDAQAGKGFVAYEAEDFVVFGRYRSGQVSQSAKDNGPLMQIAQCNFADHEGMDQHFSFAQKRHELIVRRTQMIDPDRGVNQDHDRSPRPAILS